MITGKHYLKSKKKYSYIMFKTIYLFNQKIYIISTNGVSLDTEINPDIRSFDQQT